MTLSTATIDTVNREIDKATEWLAKHECGTPYEGVDKETRAKWYYGNLESNFSSMNIRLDWENDDEQALLGAMAQQWKIEFLDLLENGDWEQSQDAFLKAFDGVRKRGVEPVNFSIIGASCYKEFKAHKNTWEGTLYFRPLIEWPKETDGTR